MVLVTFAETKVTRARGGTRIIIFQASRERYRKVLGQPPRGLPEGRKFFDVPYD
jgi:hypothetical protein